MWGRRPRLASIDLGVSLGGLFSIGTSWTPNRAEADASWELLVEMVTRTSTVGLADDEGSIREALTSLHQLFGETRAILRKYGPALAPDDSHGNESLGTIAVRILNEVLRPLLSTWHPRLLAHEQATSGGIADEAAWREAQACRDALKGIRDILRGYIETLARAAGTEAFAEALVTDLRRGAR